MKVIFLLLAVLPACGYAQAFSKKKGGHAYTLEIPEYMLKTYSLNDVASLQYMNADKEAYVIVIEDAKDRLESLDTRFTDARDFLNDFVSEYKKDAENRTLGEFKDFIANNNKHSQVEMTWTSDDLAFYMIITVVESPTHFYKIMTWTLMENKGVLKNDFLRMSKTLQDI